MAASTQDRRAMAARMRDQDAENIPIDEGDESGVGSSSRGRAGPSGTNGTSREELRRQQVELRTRLRDLEADTAGQKQSADATTDDLQSNIVKGNQIFNEITRPQEAALEVKAFINTSEIAAKKARALKIDQTAFDTGDFIEAALRIIGHKRVRRVNDSDDEQDEEDHAAGWATLGWMGARHSARVCIPDFLFGPLSVSMKERKVTKRAKLVRDEKAKVQPKIIINEGDDDHKKRTDKYAVEIYGQLTDATTANGGDPINFFEFVINPFSFSQTVENIFYLSFNIKQGIVALDVDDNSLLTIMATMAPDAKDVEEGAGKMQMVMELDMDIWRDSIKQYNITDCIWIPNREIAEEAR